MEHGQLTNGYTLRNVTIYFPLLCPQITVNSSCWGCAFPGAPTHDGIFKDPISCKYCIAIQTFCVHDSKAVHHNQQTTLCKTLSHSLALTFLLILSSVMFPAYCFLILVPIELSLSSFLSPIKILLSMNRRTCESPSVRQICLVDLPYLCFVVYYELVIYN